MTLAKRLQNYVGSLLIGQGRLAGERFTVLPWQRRFLRGCFGVAGDSALTIGRGNGKSTFLAAVGTAAVATDAPLNLARAETLIVAASYDQAGVIWEHVLSFMLPEFERYGRGRHGLYRVLDSTSARALYNRETGASVRLLSSDPRKMHGRAPLLTLADELAQWEPAKLPRAVAALRTASGKIPGSRIVWLGTRAASPAHEFERILSGLHVEYVQTHAVPAETDEKDFMRARIWQRANPSLPFMPDLKAAIKRDRDAARHDESAMAAYKSLRLNMGCADSAEAFLLDEATWRRAEYTDAKKAALWRANMRGGYVLGIDLGGGSAMSAATCYCLQTGLVDAIAAFPGTPSLATRGVRDGVAGLYVTMAKRHELFQRGVHVVPPAELLRKARERWGGPPVAIVADRWRENDLREALGKAGFPRCELILRGQGFKDGSEDVRRFRSAIMSGQASPIPSLLMRSAMSEARVLTDAAGNAKLSKNSQGGRRVRAKDDAAAAAILAVSHGSKMRATKRPFRRLRMVTV